MNKSQTAVVQVDENISQVISTKPPRKRISKYKPGFTAEQRQKSLAIRKQNAVALKQTAIETFRKYEGHIGKTCKSLGIARASFKSWIAENPEFAQAIADVREELIDNAERSLHRQSELMDFQATKFILEKLGKDRGFGPEEVNPTTQIQIAWIESPK